MTHTSTEQLELPEALRLAEMLMSGSAMIPEIDLPEAAAELRRLHARVQELEASQAQRVPLSERKIRQIDAHSGLDAIEFARAIERAHGIKEQST